MTEDGNAACLVKVTKGTAVSVLLLQGLEKVETSLRALGCSLGISGQVIERMNGKSSSQVFF